MELSKYLILVKNGSNLDFKKKQLEIGLQKLRVLNLLNKGNQ